MRAPRARAVCGLTGALLVLAGCAGLAGGPGGDAVPRPEWRVGDRWVFRRSAGSDAPAVVTHEVREATPDGYAVRITGLDREIVRHFTPDLHVSRQTVGGDAATFEPPAMYFAWPLTLGKGWSQEFEYRDGRHDARYTNHWRVAERPEAVDALGAVFRAVKIEHLGSRRERLQTYWYAPAVRYWVRLENHVSGFSEELVEFRPAGS